MHIEPVRSTTTMMSSGLTPQYEQAVALALTLNELIPSTRAKNVGTFADSSATTAFAGSQPGKLDRHLAVIDSETTPMLLSWFLPAGLVPNSCAVALAWTASGSFCAPASAAASAEAWSERWA